MAGEPGGAPGLDHLASVTGGRVTRNTNDLTLGATRAARDLGCRYTLGFYDREPGAFRVRDIRVATRREGLRVLHAASYSFRSPEEKRGSRLIAAWMVPTMFPGGVVRTHVFPLRPQDAKRWQARLAVEFPVALLGGRAASEPFTFGAAVKGNRRILHQFDRIVRLEGAGAVEPDRLLKFFQDVTLPPGTYEVTAVAEGEGGEKIFTATASVNLPEIPLGEPFLVGPTFGRAAGKDLTVRGGTRSEGKNNADDPTLDRVGTAESFAPILVTEVEKRDRIAASSLVCLVSSLAKPKPAWFERALVRRDGAPAGTLDPIKADLTEGEKVRCEVALDVIPVGMLQAGDYRFEAKLRAADQQPLDASSVPFSVIPLRPMPPIPDLVDKQP